MNLIIKDLSGKQVGDYPIRFLLIENGKGGQAVHDAVVAYRANQRQGTACTKTMGDVAGTGKKPWRQKGTGRARAGSFASPLWRGGGVVFGPKPREFRKTLPRGYRKLALRKTVSARIQDGSVILVDDLTLTAPKTRGLAAILQELAPEGTVLLVTAQPDRNIQLASRNLPGVDVTTSGDLTAYDVLRTDRIILSRAAFEHLEQRLGAEQP